MTYKYQTKSENFEPFTYYSKGKVPSKCFNYIIPPLSFTVAFSTFHGIINKDKKIKKLLFSLSTLSVIFISMDILQNYIKYRRYKI